MTSSQEQTVLKNTRVLLFSELLLPSVAKDGLGQLSPLPYTPDFEQKRAKFLIKKVTWVFTTKEASPTPNTLPQYQTN